MPRIVNEYTRRENITVSLQTKQWRKLLKKEKYTKKEMKSKVQEVLTILTLDAE
jgi:ABC-type uncharacterized transport system ATPase subunit